MAQYHKPKYWYQSHVIHAQAGILHLDSPGLFGRLRVLVAEERKSLPK